MSITFHHQTKRDMLEFQFNDLFGAIMNESPGDQEPATFPDPKHTTQMPPLNPTPDVPGTDAPEIVPGTNVKPRRESEEEIVEKKI